MQRLELWLSGKFKARQTKDAAAPFVPSEIKQRGRISLEILRLTGLFDRPITMGEFVALLKGDATDSGPIPGLTDQASEASIPTLNQAIRNLESVNLLVRVSDDPIQFKLEPWPSVEGSRPFLDAHPLVREYFAGTLTYKHEAQASESSTSSGADDPQSPEGTHSLARRACSEDSVREAHRRLYEHLKQSAPERPDNLNDMMPLYHAVAHGCKAGLWQDALDDVYFERLHRGAEAYSVKKVGAFGAELSAISQFFEKHWRKQLSTVTQADQAWVLNNASFFLRALGRLAESREPRLAALGARIAASSWENAAITASNLSELWLTLGDVSSAVRQGEQSVALADRSGDAFWRMGTRTTLAAALFCDKEREPNTLASGLSASPRRAPLAHPLILPSARPRRSNRRGSRSISCSTRCRATSTASFFWPMFACGSGISSQGADRIKRSPKLWDGLLTVPPARPKVSRNPRWGDLWSAT
ncbi:MAG: tetratricopeptide repeat protein [Planctomycetales bacterium]